MLNNFKLSSILILGMFLLIACNEESFKSNNTQKVQDPEPQTDDLEEETVDLDHIIANTSAQNGRTVEACFSYDNDKMGKAMSNAVGTTGGMGWGWGSFPTGLGMHHCDRAIFDVYFFENKKGKINLNNKNDYSSTRYSNTSTYSGGGDSVFGGKFKGAWKNGTFTVETKCALSSGCHNEVAFLSLIGEVVTKSGKKMWLKIDQGQIIPNTKYTYKFKEFELTDEKPSFGKICELK